MTPNEQTDHFANELDALVKRFASEYDITYAQIVGTLQMKVWLLCSEAQEREGEV